MRSSSYNIYVKLPDSEEYLLVHGYSGAIDLVQPNVVKFLKEFDGKNYDGVSTETVGALQKRGYLTEKSFEEEKRRVRELAEIIHRKQGKTGSSFLFVVTYNCNLRCVYCYEKNLFKRGKRWLQKVITKEMVDKAFEAMIEIEPDVQKSKNITFYGGEPLLAANYDIVEYVVNKGMKRGHVFGAITNGVELDKYLPLLGKGKIERLQITLDGPPDEHDRRRFLADGKGKCPDYTCATYCPTYCPDYGGCLIDQP